MLKTTEKKLYFNLSINYKLIICYSSFLIKYKSIDRNRWLFEVKNFQQIFFFFPMPLLLILIK